MFGVGMLADTVAQIEHMAAAVAETGQNARDFGFYTVRRTEQCKRVEIALQRDFIPHAAAGFADIAGPVQKAIGYGDFDTAFATLRDHLSKHDFIVGDRFSALDVYYTGLLNHFIRVMPMRGAPLVFTTDEPVFSAYIDRHTARPAFAETMAWAQQAVAELEKQA